MKYLCLAYGTSGGLEALTAAERAALLAELEAREAALQATGAVRASMSLGWEPATLRPRGGETVVTDGPYLETKEQVGGLVVLEARDLNDAVRVASLHPGVHLGPGVELRAVEHALPPGPFEEGPRWLLLAYGQREPFERMDAAEREAVFARCGELDQAMRATGRVVEGTGLGWDAVSLRAREGKVVVTDGPFLETKDLVGGLVTVTARDRDEALRLASMHPAAQIGEALGWAVELRAVAAGCALKA